MPHAIKLVDRLVDGVTIDLFAICSKTESVGRIYVLSQQSQHK